MGAMDHSTFVSAYQQLPALERSLVDAYIDELKDDAAKAGKPIVDYVRNAKPSDFDLTARLDDFPNAAHLLSKPLVRAAISERINELSAKFAIFAERVLREYAILGFSTIADYLDINGDGTDVKLNLNKCTKEQLAAIKKIKITQNVFTGNKTTEFEMHAKQPALDMLAVIMGMKTPDGSAVAAVRTMSQPVVAPAVREIIDASSDDARAADLYARSLKRA